MAAQSPVAATALDARDAYLVSWAAITRMLAQGKSLSGRERNSCFLNLGEHRFADGSSITGWDFLDDGRAIGVVDWDFDGRLDLWTVNRNGPQIRFLHNRLKSDNHYAAFRLKGVGSNRDAIGARVEVHLGDTDGTRLIRTLRAGEGFLSQSSKWLHFGLGSADKIEKVVVQWPGGEDAVYRDVPIDQLYLVSEGGSEFETWQPPGSRVAPTPTEPKPPEVTDTARVVLAARPLLPEIEYTDLAGVSASIDDHAGSPVLVNLWATWCQPCLAELKDLAAQSEAIRRSGLQVLALNVDELGEGGEQARRSKAAELLARLGYGWAAGTADEEALRQLDAIQMTGSGMQIPLSLPTSFLVDEQGLVAGIYRGKVTAEQLISDVGLLEAPSRSWRDVAAPFRGRWLAEPAGTEPVRVALRMADDGDRAAAIRYLDRYADQFQEGRLPEATEDILSTPLTDVYFAIARLHRQEGSQDEAVAAYEKVLAIDPEHFRSLVDLGHLFLRSGRGERALAPLETATAIRPQDAEVLSLLATIKIQQGEFKKVEELCRRILELDPENAAAWLNLGLAAEGRTDFEEALSSYRSALRLIPDWDVALNQTAWILATAPDASLRDGNEALVLASRLVEASRGQHLLFFRTLAAAQAESGEVEAAAGTVSNVLARIEGRGHPLEQRLRRDLEKYRAGEPLRIGPASSAP